MKPINASTRDEFIFKPRYPLRIRLSVYLYPIGIIACFFFIFMAFTSRSIFPYAIYAVIFGFTVLSMPMIIFREVRFGQAIKVKRYFMPARTIQYADITDFNLRGLVARHGGLPLVNLQNRAEFEKIIKKLVAQHKIKLKE
jgi:hypothetical protein